MSIRRLPDMQCFPFIWSQNPVFWETCCRALRDCWNSGKITDVEFRGSHFQVLIYCLLDPIKSFVFWPPSPEWGLRSLLALMLSGLVLLLLTLESDAAHLSVSIETTPSFESILLSWGDYTSFSWRVQKKFFKTLFSMD